MATTSYTRSYTSADFSAPPSECDIVMKGGVTSGVVYPYAVLELARAHRFRSLGGTSAGAVAAAFAAAAEYARTVRNDPEGFLRLQARCEALPDILATLFQPAPRYAALMRFLLAAQAKPGAVRIVWALLGAFWTTALVGLVLGGALLWVLDGGVAGAILGALAAMAIALAWRLWKLLGAMGREGFGMCPGVRQKGFDGPGLSDWLHASLQEIAFGDAAHPDPLTFGQMEAATTPIQLRMITTNLSQRRPHTLPRMGLPLGYRLEEWTRLFPAPVMAYLDRIAAPMRRHPELRAFPAPDALPVVVAVRMSLSFPLLFSAAPLWMRDVESAMLSRKTGGDGRVELKQVWFTDGGLSSNFPIHMFDAVLPSRPTFALSLDKLPPGAPDNGARVFIPKSAREGVGLRIYPIDTMPGFVNSLLGSAKDWQDNLLAAMPGQRERIARVMLSPEEGGLNLTMPKERSRRLMEYGLEVGERFARGGLDFDEHRWRRSLVAYEQLERTVAGVDEVWRSRGFGAWFKGYAGRSKSYRSVTKTDRNEIRLRLDAFAGLSKAFDPPIPRKDRKLPRPSGRLRIGPDF